MTTPAGEPVTGAMVELNIEPDVSDLEIGEAAELTRIGEATTDGGGCYRIPQPDASTWLNAADSNGQVELSIIVHLPTQLEMRPFTVQLTTVPVGDEAVLRVAPVDPLDVPVQLEANDVDTEAIVRGDVTQSFDGTASSGSTPMVSTDGYAETTVPDVDTMIAPNPVSDLACNGGTRWVQRADYGKRPVVVGQFWSSTPGVKQTWIYGRGAITNVGAAWSVSGDAGSYTRSLEYETTTDDLITFPTSVGKVGNYYKTMFVVKKFDEQQFDYCDSHWYYVGSEIRRTTWERGTAVTTGVDIPKTDAGNCSKFVAGSHADTSVSRAITWSDGVDLSAPLLTVLAGISLSSQTGFTKTARNHVVFTDKGRLCGVWGPLSDPGEIVARQQVN